MIMHQNTNADTKNVEQKVVKEGFSTQVRIHPNALSKKNVKFCLPGKPNLSGPSRIMNCCLENVHQKKKLHCKKIIAYTNSYVHLWSTKKDELSSLTEGVNGAVNHICEPFVDCYLVRAASFCRVYPQ